MIFKSGSNNKLFILGIFVAMHLLIAFASAEHANAAAGGIGMMTGNWDSGSSAAGPEEQIRQRVAIDARTKDRAELWTQQKQQEDALARQNQEKAQANQPTANSGNESIQNLTGTWSGTFSYTSGRAGYDLEGAGGQLWFFINSQSGKQLSGRDAMNAPLSGGYDPATRRIQLRINSAGSTSTVLSGVLSSDGTQIRGSGTTSEPDLTTHFNFTVNK